MNDQDRVLIAGMVLAASVHATLSNEGARKQIMDSDSETTELQVNNLCRFAVMMTDDLHKELKKEPNS